MPNRKIPRATAKRLPVYYRYLNVLLNANKHRVSSTELSEAVQVDSATIRRDFSYFGELGKRGYGYDVEKLLNQRRPSGGRFPRVGPDELQLPPEHQPADFSGL